MIAHDLLKRGRWAKGERRSEISTMERAQRLFNSAFNITDTDKKFSIFA